MGLFGKSNEDKQRDWYNKGLELFSIGQYEEAVKCLDTAIQLNPEDSDAWYNKGIALKELGRDEEAEQCFAKSKELE